MNISQIVTIGLLTALLSCFTAMQQASAGDNDNLTCNANAKLIFGINTDGPGESVLVVNLSDKQTIKATVSGTYMEKGEAKEIRVTRTLRPGVNAYIGKTVNPKPGIDSYEKESIGKDAATHWEIADCTFL